MTEIETNPIELSGRVKWFEDNVHKMSSVVLRRNLLDTERRMELSSKVLPVEQFNDCLAIATLLRNRLDEITPKLPADIEAHDRSVSDRVLERWPIERSQASRNLHHHFCELVFAWTMNPFKTEFGTASVDEFAESFGISRFAFISQRDADEWLDVYGLDDFIVNRGEERVQNVASEAPSFHYVTLSNSFTTTEINAFFDVYKSSMNALSVLQDERKRAIINDGGRIGFACMDHFVTRELAELTKIKLARETLGAGFKELNK